MRTVELGRTAAQAELLRFKALVKRQTMRGAWGAVAAAFGIAVLVMIHVLAFMILVPFVGPIWAAVIVLAFDLVMLVIFGLMAAKSTPGTVETQARDIRDQALLEMRESVAIAALINPVGRVVVRSAGRGVMNAMTPGFMQRKRRR